MPEVDAELTRALRGVTLAVQNYRLRAARSGFGVGATEMMALAMLFVEGPSNPTALAAHLSLTTASATELIDRLERAGHVSRAPHPTDRRMVVVGMTEVASTRMERMFRRAAEATATAAQPLTVAELRAVTRFLYDVAEEYDRTEP